MSVNERADISTLSYPDTSKNFYNKVEVKGHLLIPENLRKIRSGINDPPDPAQKLYSILGTPKTMIERGANEFFLD